MYTTFFLGSSASTSSPCLTPKGIDRSDDKCVTTKKRKLDFDFWNQNNSQQQKTSDDVTLEIELFGNLSAGP
jgi:hypothetical protein